MSNPHANDSDEGLKYQLEDERERELEEELDREAEDVGGSKVVLWLIIVGLGALVVSMAQSILIPVMPDLPGDLHTSSGAIEWLLTSTLLVGAVAVPLMGRLGDMWGKRLMLLVAIGAMVVGSFITAVSSNITVLIIGRAIQGLSMAAIPLGISLLATLLPISRRASAMAAISAMLGVGGALGLPLAGFIGEHGDYHLLFWVTTIASAISFLGIIFLLPEAKDSAGGRVDVFGALLLAGALVALLLPLSEGSAWGWHSATTLILFVASAVLFAALGLWEARRRDPLIDLHSLGRRPIVLTNIASLFIGFALFASLIGTATYVQAPKVSGYGFATTTLEAGLTMLPSGILMLILSPVASRLITKIGAHYTLAIGGAIIAIGWVMRISLTGSLFEIILGSTVVGIGTGIGYSTMPTLISGNTPHHELAAANGLNALVRSLGSSLASALGGSILAGFTLSGPLAGLPSLAGYRVLFAICAGAALVAAVIALFVPGRKGAAGQSAAAHS